MNSKRPVTITASEFVANDYAAKVARGECVVMFGGGQVVDIDIEGRDIKGEQGGTCALWANDKFTVEWLPIPPSRYADLLPQTVDTVRYGTPEFEQLAREDAEAEIKRLQAELTDVKNENAQLRNMLAELGYLA